MEIWTQSLAWAMIYGVGQGLLIFTVLAVLLKIIPGAFAGARYYLSLTAMAVLLIWFVNTWQAHFHAFTVASSVVKGTTSATTVLWTSIIAGHPGYWERLLLSLRPALHFLSIGYVVGLLLMTARMLVGMGQLFSLKRQGTTLPDEQLTKLFQQLNERMGRLSATLLLSARAHVPMVIGTLKPVILLPAATAAQLTTDQLEAILLHELAHLKRYDYLVNILQIVVETMLFFNPFVWMISSTVRREREHSCDDVVLRHIHAPISYATALAALVGRGDNYPTIVVAAPGRPAHLFNRIKRIMEMKKTPFSYSRAIAAVLIVAGFACSVAWMPPAFSKLKKEKERDATPATRTGAVNATLMEENLLVDRLLAAGLIDQVKGFVVEKHDNTLVINGKTQPEDVARQYLQSINKPEIRVQVFSFIERLNQHPDAGFIQLLLPVSNSSGCVDYKSKPKEGC